LVIPVSGACVIVANGETLKLGKDTASDASTVTVDIDVFGYTR